MTDERLAQIKELTANMIGGEILLDPIYEHSLSANNLILIMRELMAGIEHYRAHFHSHDTRLKHIQNEVSTHASGLEQWRKIALEAGEGLKLVPAIQAERDQLRLENAELKKKLQEKRLVNTNE